MIRAIVEVLFLALLVAALATSIVLLADWLGNCACASTYTDMDAARSAQRECLNNGGVAVVRGMDEVTIECQL